MRFKILVRICRKMYLRLLVPLIISLFFNFLHCFNYTEEIYNNKDLQDLNIRLCSEAEADISARVNTCRRVFKLLRDDPTQNNPFRHSLYMNYEAFFSSSNPVCEMRSIQVNQNTKSQLISLTCYGRLAVLSKNNSKFLKEISIFRGPQDSLIVFRCSDSDPCQLQEWYEKDKWSKELLFLKPPMSLDFVRAIKIPITAGTEELSSVFKKPQVQLYRMSKRDSHFMNQHNMTKQKLDKMCQVLLGRPQYREKCNLSPLKNIDKGKVIRKQRYTLTIYEPFNATKQSSEKKINIFGYGCSKCNNKRFRLIAGSNYTYVILIEPKMCNGKPCLVPVEMIKNLSLDYVLHIEEYF